VFLASDPVADRAARGHAIAALDEQSTSPARRPSWLSTRTSVRLCDVFPDGRVMLLADAARRVSLRRSFSRPQPVESGRQVTVEVILPDLAFDLQPGHRLGLAISASNAPRYEVSPVPVRLTIHGGSTLDLPGGR
jgi:hypothetical protein